MALTSRIDDNAIVQMMMSAIKYVAKRDNVPERLVKAMQFRVDCHRDMQRMAYALRCQWKDPFDGSLVRAFELLLDDWDLKERDHLQRNILVSIDNINLRGELFFFKLHKHFPNRIEKVRCEPSGRVHVMFKNGRELSVDEQNLDSVEFLATCGMVYDL